MGEKFLEYENLYFYDFLPQIIKIEATTTDFWVFLIFRGLEFSIFVKNLNFLIFNKISKYFSSHKKLYTKKAKERHVIQHNDSQIISCPKFVGLFFSLDKRMETVPEIVDQRWIHERGLADFE